MKHNFKITIILLAMFIITQFIGLYVVDYYSSIKIIDGVPQKVSAPHLPYGMQTPEIQRESDFYKILPSIIIAFVIAISLVFLLSKYNIEFVLKLWFFVVVVIALGIAFNSFFNAFFPQIKYLAIITLFIALPLAFYKIYRRGFLVHNITELFIYPGIAAVFVPILNIWTIIILLILISAYDIWAVWHSGFMQKMAKYQINKLKIFSGFFVPYLSKKEKLKVRKIRAEYRTRTKKKSFWQRLFNNNRKTKQRSKDKGVKIRVSVGILGGGDVIFPIIAAGVMLKTLGLISALLIIFGATLGLTYLFIFSEKKKFYPAMPFITTGIFIGMILGVVLRMFF